MLAAVEQPVETASNPSRRSAVHTPTPQHSYRNCLQMGMGVDVIRDPQSFPNPGGLRPTHGHLLREVSRVVGRLFLTPE